MFLMDFLMDIFYVFYGYFSGQPFTVSVSSLQHSLPLEVLILSCDHYAKGNLWKIHCQVLPSSLQSA